MHPCRCWAWGLGAVAAVAAVASARAQDTTTLASATQSIWVPLATSTSPLAARAVTLELSRATVAEALDQLSARADVPVLYDDSVLPRARVVSIRAAHLTM